MKEWLLALCIGYAMDLLFGDPHGLWHPVQGIGWCISRVEKVLRKLFSKSKSGERLAGIIFVIVVLTVSTAIPFGILLLSGLIHPYLRFIIECLMCYQILATKSLKDESMKVYHKLEEDDFERARYAVSMIVGRDTDGLTKEEITKATIETVAENTSDGIIAPVIFMACLGPIGGFFYKAVNTMDSMVGYKNDKYLYFGSSAAHLDDILNYIPARISAYLMIWATLCMGLDWKHAYRIYKRDRRKHASPNSAQTEAVMAGALQIQLAGDAYYQGCLYQKPTIGDSLREVKCQDIKTANKLLYATSFIGIVIIGVIGVLL